MSIAKGKKFEKFQTAYHRVEREKLNKLVYHNVYEICHYRAEIDFNAGVFTCVCESNEKNLVEKREIPFIEGLIRHLLVKLKCAREPSL